MTAMEKRANEAAETIVDFSGVRMMTSQIPGLARLLVMFAENEIRLRRHGLSNETAFLVGEAPQPPQEKEEGNVSRMDTKADADR